MKYSSMNSGLRDLAIYTAVAFTIIGSAMQAKAQDILNKFRTPDYHAGELSDNVRLNTGQGLEIIIGDGVYGEKDGMPDHLLALSKGKRYEIRGSKYFDHVDDYGKLEKTLLKGEFVRLYNKVNRLAKKTGKKVNVNAVKQLAVKYARDEIKKYKQAGAFGSDVYNKAKKKSPQYKKKFPKSQQPLFKTALTNPLFNKRQLAPRRDRSFKVASR